MSVLHHDQICIQHFQTSVKHITEAFSLCLSLFFIKILMNRENTECNFKILFYCYSPIFEICEARVCFYSNHHSVNTPLINIYIYIYICIYIYVYMYYRIPIHYIYIYIYSCISNNCQKSIRCKDKYK